MADDSMLFRGCCTEFQIKNSWGECIEGEMIATLYNAAAKSDATNLTCNGFVGNKWKCFHTACWRIEVISRDALGYSLNDPQSPSIPLKQPLQLSSLLVFSC